jgi:H+/gluconate symporter-like permease
MSLPSSQQTQVAGKVGFFTKFKVPFMVVGFMVSMTTYLMVYRPYTKQVQRRENQEMADSIYEARQNEKAEANFQ